MTAPRQPEPEQPALEAIAGLAREIDVLTQAVAELRGVPAQLADLAGIVATLGERNVARPPAAAGGPGTWLDLEADFADTVAVLGELVGWLATVYLRYSDAASGLPECWLWHGDVVEELLWLRGAWTEAYAGERASVAAAGDWHDRQRPGVVRRIRAVAGTCSLEAHQPRGDRHRGAEPVPLAEAIHLIGEWWATARDTTAPAPDAGHIAAAAALRAGRGRR